ncbi:MAG: phosphopantothenoylcysteine decarboxylase [Candidatus Omnitrophica bacterium]|nr:phosphopantothenoylcysteine decarboxylase [Candidatus Omnitrophota bacterium]
MKTREIILGVSASIAIYKTCLLIRRLKDEGFNVTVVMTEKAKEFIQPLLFERLSQNKVYTEFFSKIDDYKIEHISLADKADLVLLAPATADLIGRIASGIADDLLTSLVMATKAKVWICPAMDENMYRNKIVQYNIKKLKSYGYKFIGPQKGKLASGKMGWGRLVEIETIVQKVKEYFL